MSRLIDAFEQFFDANGQPLSNGYLRFYENETTTLQDTYEDDAQTIPNANPMQLTGDGRVNGNVYASLVYTVQLLDVNLNVIESYDNVEPRGGVSTGSTIPNWDSTANYVANNSIVLAGDGNYYIAIQANMNQNPVSDTNFEYWKRVKFDEWYSQFITYSLNDIVIASDGQQYISLTGSNINNNPVGNGGVQWELYTTNEWSTGKSYLAGDVRIADNGRWYKAVIDNSGNEPSADDGTNWLPIEGVVDTPNVVSPADLDTDVLTSPSIQLSAFSSTGYTDTQEYLHIQISEESDFSTLNYSSGADLDSTDTHLVASMLSPATTYYARGMYKGVRSGVSSFSSAVSFTTIPDLGTVFDIYQDNGTGAEKFIPTGIDLSTKSGSVWIFNRDIVSNIKKMDTIRGFNEFDIDDNTPEAANAQGVKSYAVNGITVGTDADYNGSGNAISVYTYQNRTGFHSVIQYTGNLSSRTLSHNLGVQCGAVLGKVKSATASTGNDYFWFGHKDLSGAGLSPGNASSAANVYGVFNDSTVGIGAQANMNTSGSDYVLECFAHNPAQRIFCGTYTGTGLSGNKITTGFKVGKFMTFNNFAEGYIADIVAGVGSHIKMNQAGNTEQPGSVSSFDSDGVTLDGNGLNTSGRTYYFVAVGDPSEP